MAPFILFMYGDIIWLCFEEYIWQSRKNPQIKKYDLMIINLKTCRKESNFIYFWKSNCILKIVYCPFVRQQRGLTNCKNAVCILSKQCDYIGWLIIIMMFSLLSYNFTLFMIVFRQCAAAILLLRYLVTFLKWSLKGNVICNMEIRIFEKIIWNWIN